MTGSQMPTVRRRIPGMTSQPSTPESTATVNPDAATGMAAETEGQTPTALAPAPPAVDESVEQAQARPERPRRAGQSTGTAAVPRRRPARDYTTTRLVNFRIPSDLHDRFRELMHDVESEHPKLRNPSLTELVIALLEEGPETADQVAQLIRRKRAAELEAEV
jgi:hypothetical protein